MGNIMKKTLSITLLFVIASSCKGAELNQNCNFTDILNKMTTIFQKKIKLFKPYEDLNSLFIKVKELKQTSNTISINKNLIKLIMDDSEKLLSQFKNLLKKAQKIIKNEGKKIIALEKKENEINEIIYSIKDLKNSGKISKKCYKQNKKDQKQKKKKIKEHKKISTKIFDILCEEKFDVFDRKTKTIGTYINDCIKIKTEAPKLLDEEMKCII